MRVLGQRGGWTAGDSSNKPTPLTPMGLGFRAWGLGLGVWGVGVGGGMFGLGWVVSPSGCPLKQRRSQKLCLFWKNRGMVVYFEQLNLLLFALPSALCPIHATPLGTTIAHILDLPLSPKYSSKPALHPKPST